MARVHNAEQIIRTEATIALSKSQTCTIKRTQFPIMLAWACTIHKAQVLTLENLYVPFNLSKQKTFGNCQIYVALSRAKYMNSLYVSGKVEKSMIRADQDALDKYERLRKEVNLLNQTIFVMRFQMHYCCY